MSGNHQAPSHLHGQWNTYLTDTYHKTRVGGVGARIRKNLQANKGNMLYTARHWQQLHRRVTRNPTFNAELALKRVLWYFSKWPMKQQSKLVGATKTGLSVLSPRLRVRDYLATGESKVDFE